MDRFILRKADIDFKINLYLIPLDYKEIFEHSYALMKEIERDDLHFNKNDTWINLYSFIKRFSEYIVDIEQLNKAYILMAEHPNQSQITKNQIVEKNID